jgi:hypothetical protein
MEKCCDALEVGNVLVFPDAEVGDGDAASGTTAEASRMTRPAPPWARAPRWTRCQSAANPSTEEYSHMGETPMRLAKETERS